MRKGIGFILICFILSLLCSAFVACEKQSELIHIVETEDFDFRQQNVESGSKTRLHIIAQSQNSDISRILLTEYDSQYGDNTIFDTVFTHKERSIDYWYNYQIPLFTDTTIMRFSSQIWTETGNTITYQFAFKVIPAGGNIIRTIDGITMYSALSGKKYGFSLIELNTVFPETLSSDTLVFFDQEQSDSTRTDILSRIWQSNGGIYFSRFESFDYGEATVASIQYAYDIGKHENIIQNISNDDIILFGTKAEAYGVIKVLLVSDEEGTDNDRYVFSIKTFLQPGT